MPSCILYFRAVYNTAIAANVEIIFIVTDTLVWSIKNCLACRLGYYWTVDLANQGRFFEYKICLTNTITLIVRVITNCILNRRAVNNTLIII